MDLVDGVFSIIIGIGILMLFVDNSSQPEPVAIIEQGENIPMFSGDGSLGDQPPPVGNEDPDGGSCCLDLFNVHHWDNMLH